MERTQTLTLSVIVPATNAPSTLGACLEALQRADEPPEQVIVIEDRAITHAAVARNVGAKTAVGDVLVFIDADVTVHPDAIARIRRAFAADPDLVALFGSYDDAPAARSIVSVTRNLLHHHVHQRAAGRASTFWTGLGAIRRQSFEDIGGFTEHPIEDIELGMRLAQHGDLVLLDPAIQGKHLKKWSMLNMLRTDLLVRGIPWVGLLLERRRSSTTSALNLGWAHRISALSCVVLVLAAIFVKPLVTLAALAVLVVCNFDFYGLLLRREGMLRAIGGVGVHIAHLLVAVLSVPLGVFRHFVRQRGADSRSTVDGA